MEHIFPYLVTADYPIDITSGKSVSIGNGIYAVYVVDQKGLVASFDISSEVGSAKTKLQNKAIENLRMAFKSEIKAMSFENGPGGSQFILVGNHWSAAAQILNPDLLSWAQKILETDKVIISIPNRDTLLIFPNMDKKFFKAIRSLAREKEEVERKLLTFELFELSSSGLKSVKE